jgi:hypothetical protein
LWRAVTLAWRVKSAAEGPTGPRSLRNEVGTGIQSRQTAVPAKLTASGRERGDLAALIGVAGGCQPRAAPKT